MKLIIFGASETLLLEMSCIWTVMAQAKPRIHAGVCGHNLFRDTLSPLCHQFLLLSGVALTIKSMWCKNFNIQ